MSGFGRNGFMVPRDVWLSRMAGRGDKVEVLKLLAEGANVKTKDNDGSTPLHKASFNGHADVARALIAKGAKINAKDYGGRTPLHEASSAGHASVAKALIEEGADTNAKDMKGMTPLLLAIENGHGCVTKTLISRGANVNAKGYDGRTPLHEASFRGNVDMVKVLISKGADVGAKDEYGRTPRRLAIRYGHTNVAEALLIKDSDVYAKSDGGWTQLHLAIMNGIEVAQALISEGADVNAKSGTGSTLLHEASSQGCVDAIDELLTVGAGVNAKDGDRRTPLHRASSKGHADVVEALIAKGADVHAKEKDGLTPLHEASSAEVANALIAKGADVNVKSDNGNTPLHWAIMNRHANVADALLAKGADVDAKNKRGVKPLFAKGADEANHEHGLTPLHEASSNGHANMAKALIAEGSDVNAMDNDGRMPLHWAGSEGHTNVAKTLIAKGGNVNAKSMNGMTPLLLAIENGHAHTTKVLLANGADVNARGYFGNTPLLLASKNGDIDVIEALLARGADVAVKNNGGMSPLDVAKIRGKVSVVSALEDAKAEREAPDLRPETDQNRAMRFGASDAGENENTGGGEKTDQIRAGPADGDGAGKKSGTSDAPSDQMRVEFTDDECLFLRELARDGGNGTPAISKEERSALRTLAAKMDDIERSLQSVQELPPSLSGRGSEAAEYFLFFANAFERASVAARALTSGAVKVDLGVASEAMPLMLGGASWVADKCDIALPFAGCISIFSAIIKHQHETKKKNTFVAFEEFFRGNCRDQYLLTYRKIAEQFCLQLDIVLAESKPGKTGKIKEQVMNKIVAPIRKYLRTIHLDTIQQLSPVEERAMSDLASVTSEVLRLHQDEHHTYDKLRSSNECVKASYFVDHIFGTPLVSPPHREQKSSTGGASHHSSRELLASGSQPQSMATEAQLQHMLEKIQSLEEHNDANARMTGANANMAQEVKQMQAQIRKLTAEVERQKNVAVPSGRQVQMQMNRDEPKEELHRQGQHLNLAQMEEKICQLQIEQERQSREVEKMKFEHFVNNRVLSFHETFELTQKILSMTSIGDGNKIEVSEDGWFVFRGKEYCIGVVCKGGLLIKKKTLWKGKVGIKLEEEHQGVKSIMDWFDQIKLRPLYERSKKNAIHAIFADELDALPCLPDMSQPYQSQYAQGDRDELLDVSLGLR